MAKDFFSALKDEPRVLMEAELRPVQGERFQATGFKDIGPARYQLHDGTEMLLVESAQSVANRLEAVCWDEAKNDLITELEGLPYVKVELGMKDKNGRPKYGVTSTLLEFHRLNSPYIWSGGTDKSGENFREAFKKLIGVEESSKGGKQGDEVAGVLDMRTLANAVFTYDPNSVIHGVFLTKIAGRLSLTRALSGFIEARNVGETESGGVKFDRVFPSKMVFPGNTKKEEITLDAGEGFTNVPFHRTEFTAKAITAYFNLDLALLRGYGLPEEATELLIALSLFKVQRFLSTGLRLRTACDLETTNGLNVTRPEGFEVPPDEVLLDLLKGKIKACKAAKLFPEESITEIEWKKPTKKKKDTAEE